MARDWMPCRSCGKNHTNPSSSSICPDCGAREREAGQRAREKSEREFNESPFGQFMAMSENDRWEWVFDRLSEVSS